MIQRWTLLLSIVIAVVSSVHADEPDQIVAPVIQQALVKDQVETGAFTADITAQPLNALDIIRSELNQLQTREHAQSQNEGVFVSTAKRFTPESLTFFVAIGAVTFNSMWIRSHGDPLAMQKHILSLKDPIANLSFFSFMLANGFYIDLQTKNMDAHTKAQMMHRLSYQGMAVGSLASSIVSDLGQSAKMCVNKWILGQQDETSIQSCNEAWKNWTLRNKFTQYFPQIMSMWATQAITNGIDRLGRYGFEKASATSFAKKILNKKWLVRQAFKVTGADIAMSFTGGTWTVRGIKLVGKVLQFGLFVAVDHALSHYTLRPLNSVLQPLFVDFDAMTINKYWAAYDEGDWDEKKVIQPPTTCISPPVFILKLYQKCIENSFEKEIEDYGQHMQSWRENLNSDVEGDLAGWMEMTKKLLNQFDYAYKFYKSFVSTLLESLNGGHRIQTGQATPEIFTNGSNYPFRTLPLYGVSMGNIQLLGGQADDLYLNRPFEIEKRQMEHIQDVIKQEQLTPTKASAEAFKKYNEILALLKSSDVNIVASGLHAMNNIFRSENTFQIAPANSSARGELISIFTKLRQKIGNPYPVMYPFLGFTQAFSVNGPMKVISSEADFSLWSMTQNYHFTKETDLLLYKMICGNEVAGFDKTRVLGINMIMPQYSPPTLLKNDPSRNDFCTKERTTANMYNATIGGKSLRDYILANLNYNAIGDFQKTDKAVQFENWWLTNGKFPVTQEFAEYDKKFKVLVEMTEENIFNTKTGFKKYADYLNQSQYLKSNLKDQLKVETEFYLQLIQRALAQKIKKPIALDKVGYRNYLLQTVLLSQNTTFVGLNDVTNLQVQTVSKLMSEYPQFILSLDSNNFDKYIVHSKKIDSAINDILVLAGFKKEEKSTGGSQSDDLTATASATGTETSNSVYTDIEVKNPNLRQRVILAAVKGLRQIESENRRFIRMKIMLSKSLEVDTQEFLSDWNSTNKDSRNKNSKAASPRG